MKNSKGVKKNLNVNGVAKCKRSSYRSISTNNNNNKSSPKNKKTRQTNKLKITNASSTTSDQQLIVTHQHIEVFTEEMTLESKLVRKPSKPGISQGKPGQHN